MIYTTEIIADIFRLSGDSVTFINRDADYAAYIDRTASGKTEAFWKAGIKRNVDHLELIKDFKHEDGSSIWTTEDFTEIDAAIVKGKTLYGG
jgi:hypothetical protein|tara:strand:+ start:454 stop:729 length:276 start_codon:yes stop_codon:yes gene_type:complete